MKITEMTSETFWKGEMGVSGIVEDGDDSYRVKLEVKGSQVRDYTCSCAQGNSSSGMCVHAKLVWKEWQEQQKQGGGKTVSTSPEVRAMIREYTNREVAKIIQEGEEEQVRLVPRLMLRPKECGLEFKIGRERLYVLKDLTAFARAVENGEYVEYGKNMGFHHSISAFAEEDRALAALVVELVGVYQEHMKQFQKSSFVTVQGMRELNLSRASRDRFFKLMVGRQLEVEDRQGGRRTVQVIEGPVELRVKIRRAGRDGIRVSLDPALYCLFGEHHLYVGDEQEIRCLDRPASDMLSVFMEQMVATWGSDHTVEIQDKDMPLFYERVLQQIMPCSVLDSEGVNLEDYRPQELKARFDFDSGRLGEMTMRPTLSYGDYSFHPVEDDKVPRTVCRDVPGEFRISQMITKYFKFREDGTDNLVIRDDDDAMYRLLQEGIQEFMELGEVYISEEARKIRVLPPSKMDVGVRVMGGWLELTVDAEGMSSADLARILTSYDRKKPYYRMKNGEFLQLGDNGLMTVARLVDGLAVSRAQLQAGAVRVPAYRALYLDSVLKEDGRVTLYRDNMFKALVRGMKSVEDSDYEIPETLKPVLREYQKTGFRWLRTLDSCGFGGILADDMGLGKTIQMLAVLLDEKQKAGEKHAVSLIICPASLVYNWENEIHSFAPSLKVEVVAGTAAERSGQLEKWQDFDVLVTSYDLLKRDALLYQEMEFRFQVIDEAQYIKNPGTQSAKAVKTIQARTRYALTGTPIENRLSELWSIFDYLMPGFLFGYQKFRKEYEVPIVREGDSAALKRLHRMIGPFVLRRLKRDVLKELPEKLETVVYSCSGEAQRELYMAHALKLKEQLKEHGLEPADKIQVLTQLTRLRQLCCDPSLCYSNYKGGSAKLDTCVDLILGGIDGGHKILLFSQFTSMLELIEKRLKKEGVAYHVLTGSTPKDERIRMVGAFQSDDTPVFLISLKAGGTGLNLTAADIVIHYDPWWNVAAQNQATDRTHRIGQTRQVSVFKLIMKDTIEENMIRLQESKRELAEQVITEGTLSLGSLTKEDLLKILE